MSSSEPIPFAAGDVVRLRKPHPCGGYDWTVVRLGADIGMTCNHCGRRVMLPRRDLERRLKLFVARGPQQPQLDVGSASASSPVGAGETGT